MNKYFSLLSLLFSILILGNLKFALAYIIDDLKVDEKNLCSNPAKYVCDENINSSLTNNKRSENQFNLIEQNAQKDPKVQKFISENSKKGGAYCFELEDNDDYNECAKLRYAIMEKNLFTKKRKDVALELFKKAKYSILKVLEKREQSLASFGMSSSKENLLKMISEIKEAQLHFSSTDHLNLSYNAAARSRGLDSDEVWYRFLGQYAKTTNTIFLEGLIINAEYNPEALYRTLLHELSHFIDPSSKFRKDSKFSQNPFQRELMCLKREDSSYAQTGNAECFEKIGKKYRSKDPKFSDAVNLTAKFIRINPDVGWSSPRFPPDENECQLGQLGEAFSDWLASEAYLVDNPIVEFESMEGIYEKNGHRIVDIRQRFQLLPHLLESVASFCSHSNLEREILWTREKQKGIHPMSTDRLNAIMLAHPKIKEALGCSSAEIYQLQNLNENPLPQGFVYCGAELSRNK